MGSLVLTGDTSGSVTVAVPAVAGTNTATFPAATGTVVISGQNSAITSSTAVASTSGTSIDFTSIPSWVKRITVMFNGVSTNGTSNLQIQIGSGSVSTSGYSSSATFFSSSGGSSTSTAGLIITSALVAASVSNGNIMLCLQNNNTWTSSGVLSLVTSAATQFSGGVSSTLGGTLDRVRITTVNGTDTFDAGSINILYE